MASSRILSHICLLALQFIINQKSFWNFGIFLLCCQPSCYKSNSDCTASSCGVCYNCCTNDEIDYTNLPRRSSSQFDCYVALQDLRSIHGLSSESLVTSNDLRYDDIINSTYDDHQRIMELRGDSIGGCCSCLRIQPRR